MEFSAFRSAVQAAFKEMQSHGTVFRSSADVEVLWNIYLDSFPAGTNDIFRVRRERDCSSCHTFVRHIGAAVVIVDGNIKSLWDFVAERVEHPYDVVVEAMAAFIRHWQHNIKDVFYHEFGATVGTDKNRSLDGDGNLTVYEHLFVHLPTSMALSPARIGPVMSEQRAQFDVLDRSFKEITDDAVETVYELITSNALYRGAEKEGHVRAFQEAKAVYNLLDSDAKKANYVWSLVGSGSFVAKIKIRSDVIGTLLVDLSEGRNLEDAVKAFEDKVSGTNYQRTTALVTESMKKKARETLVNLGLMASLERRYARYEDLSINNLLFANPTAKRRMGDVLDSIQTKSVKAPDLGKEQTVSIDFFISDILPKVDSVEVLVENKLLSNLMSLITTADPTAPPLFKWENPFSWTYKGEVADSVKERVKAAGGSVEGDLCCRLAWSNFDDLDFHMLEPKGEEIFYAYKRSATTRGELDVDMNAGGGTTRTPVENIFYPDRRKMTPGKYHLFVRQFCRRESTNVGFTVDIEVDGQIHRLSYPKAVSKDVPVATITVDREHNITVAPHIEGGLDSRTQEVWGIQTNQFVPVTVLMASPNFWEYPGIGNKHWFFMLAGCNNPDTARGFYNEFLRPEIYEHRKTMEQVGSVVRADQNPDQMSGLGFSSTQRNEITVRVSGAFSRVLKVTF